MINYVFIVFNTKTSNFSIKAVSSRTIKEMAQHKRGRHASHFKCIKCIIILLIINVLFQTFNIITIICVLRCIYLLIILNLPLNKVNTQSNLNNNK